MYVSKNVCHFKAREKLLSDVNNDDDDLTPVATPVSKFANEQLESAYISDYFLCNSMKSNFSRLWFR